MSNRPSHTAKAQRGARALKKYGENTAGKQVRKTAFRECDYTTDGKLMEFDTEEEVLAFEEARYQDGTGHNVKLSKKPNDAVPKVQLALEKSLEHTIASDGNETRVQLVEAEEHLHQRHDETQQQLGTMSKQIGSLTERLNACPETCASPQVPENPLVRAATKKVLQTNLREIAKLDKKSAVQQLTGHVCREKHGPGTFKIIDALVGQNGANHLALVDKQAFDKYQQAARNAEAKGLLAPQGEVDTIIAEEVEFQATYEVIDSFREGAVVKFTQDSKDGAPYRAGFYAKVLEFQAGAALVPVELTHQLEGKQPRHIKLKVPRGHLEACELVPDKLDNPHPHEWCGIEVKILGEALPANLAKFAGLYGKIVDATTSKKTNVVKVRCFYEGSSKHFTCALPLPEGAKFDEQAFDALFQRSGCYVNAQKPKASGVKRKAQKGSAASAEREQQRPAKRARRASTASDQKAHREIVNALASDADWKDIVKLVRKHLAYAKGSHSTAGCLKETLRIANDAKEKVMDAYEATYGDEQGKVLAKKVMEKAFMKSVAENPTKVGIAFQTWLCHLKEAASKQVPADQLMFEEIPADEDEEDDVREEADDGQQDESELSTIPEVESIPSASSSKPSALKGSAIK